MEGYLHPFDNTAVIHELQDSRFVRFPWRCDDDVFKGTRKTKEWFARFRIDL